MKFKDFNDWKSQRIKWWYTPDYRAMEAIATALELWNKPHLAKTVRRHALISAHNYVNIVCALLIGFFVGLWTSSATAQSASNWENSPYNWQNSQYNYENSSTKWENNPNNWNNNPNNYNSRNGVYDNSGNRTGYETISPSGVKNYYDNSGNRQGYAPYGR